MQSWSRDESLRAVKSWIEGLQRCRREVPTCLADHFLTRRPIGEASPTAKCIENENLNEIVPAKHLLFIAVVSFAAASYPIHPSSGSAGLYTDTRR